MPAWRVYVYGVDVTEDVSSCNVNCGDGRQPSICEFALASEQDRYVATGEDIAALYQDIRVADIEGQDRALTASDASLVDAAIARVVQKEVKDPVKRRILLAKVKERFTTADIGKDKTTQRQVADGLEWSRIIDKAEAEKAAAVGITSSAKFAALRGDLLRFPLQVGQCVFHTGDAVRIFWRDPFDSSQWYFAFTGTISDWKESIDPNGKRVVTLMAEDALRPFRLARIAANPNIFDVSVVTDNQYDYLIRDWHAERFSELSFPEIVFTIAFGPGGKSTQNDETLQSNETSQSNKKTITTFRYGVFNKTQVQNLSLIGVGLFNEKRSGVYSFGPVDTKYQPTANVFGKAFQPIATLEDWQAIVDHKIPATIDDLLATYCLPEYRDQQKKAISTSSSGALSAENAMQIIGEHPEIYPVDFGRILMLVPSSLGPGTSRDIMFADFGDGVAAQTETQTRLQILYNICQRLDFSLYATPRGDIVFEMPLYSFAPEDFGRFADLYRFSMDDITAWESHFEDNKVKTLFQSRAFITQYKGVGTYSDVGHQPATATLKSLFPQFGIRSETIDPYAAIRTDAGAAYYAFIKLSQLNADAWQQNISTVLRLGIGPNRPCWFESRDFIASTRNINSSIVWGQSGSVSQTVKVNYRRGWSGQIVPESNPPKHVYEPYGGKMSNPIDYALLFSQNSAKAKESSKSLTLMPDITPPSESIIKANEEKIHKQTRILIEELNARYGLNIKSTDQLEGSLTRSVAKNQEVKGKKNSFHLSGLAVDYPVSKLAKFQLSDGSSLTPQVLASVIKDLQRGQSTLSDRSISMDPSASVLLERGDKIDTENPDHVHFGLGEASGHQHSHDPDEPER